MTTPQSEETKQETPQSKYDQPVFEREYTRNGARPWSSARPRVVVVGAGFGGLNAARQLAGEDVDVLIIDRNNYHGFWPLLYQIATAGLEPEAIAYPVRAIIRKHSNISFQMVEVTGVDLERKLVHTNIDPVPYDYLILAAGSANNYFGNDALADHTYGLKDVDEAERIRNHVLALFERAISEPDRERREAMMTLVVVGGGPTGVELAGAFVELIDHVLQQDYPMLELAETHVVLVEAIDTVLASFPKNLQQTALDRLKDMGVDVRLNTMVADVESGRVIFKDGSSLDTGTVIWAAGVRSAPISDELGVEQARGKRVKVEPTLNLPGRTDVFVVGDMAYLEGYQGGDQAYPMVAPVAIQQAARAAKNIVALTRNKSMRPFRYFDKGNMATIGRRSAVLDSFGIRLTGYIAWAGWLIVHLMSLVGFRNRLIVLTNWAYSYFTYDRGVRLITGSQVEDQMEPSMSGPEPQAQHGD